MHVIICLEEKSHEGSLLCWLPGGKGYTADFEKAGLFNTDFAQNINEKGRDLAVTPEQLKLIPSYEEKRIIKVSSSKLHLIKSKYVKGVK